MLRGLIAIGSASIVNVSSVALLNLFLAKILAVEEFGIVRTVTAYTVALTMLGNFSLQDALTFHIANSKKEDFSKLFFHAAIMTIFSSCLVAVGASVTFYNSDMWQGDLKIALLLVSALLPALCLTIMYSNTLQALGSHRTYAIVSVLSGLVPLFTIALFSYIWSLEGWLLGRSLTAGAMLLIAYYLLREYISICAVNYSYIAKMWEFSRIQIFSGVLSLILMSFDVIYLKYITNNLSIIAYYGLAQLFAKAPLFLVNAISRSYFKAIAPSSDGYEKKTREFLLLTTSIAIFVALTIYHACPVLITRIYGEEYGPANSLVKIMTIGTFFNFLWSAILAIALAQGKPKISVKVNIVSAAIAAILLYTLTPHYDAAGAAWAMNLAYAAGSLLGLFLIRKPVLSTYARL